MNCECGRESIIILSGTNRHLCRFCFNKMIRKKVARTIHDDKMIGGNQKIGFAISGGKDSLVAMHLIHSHYKKRNDLDFVAITIDEGIAGYREEGIAMCKENCEKLNIAYHIFTFKEIFGFSLDEIATLQDEIKPCTYCGVFRRQALNFASRKLGIDVLVFGHNADDESQSVLMNFFRGDTKRLTRMGFVRKKSAHSKWVKRIKPLQRVLERETVAYALTNNIHVDFAECPHVTDAFRVKVRDILNELENSYPGTKYTVLSTFDDLKENYFPKEQPSEEAIPLCERCEEPTSKKGVCKSCQLIERIKNLKKDSKS